MPHKATKQQRDTRPLITPRQSRCRSMPCRRPTRPWIVWPTAASCRCCSSSVIETQPALVQR
eukprot:scaffold668547_cov85-Prasinocladus_malaysianus.AAC.1